MHIVMMGDHDSQEEVIPQEEVGSARSEICTGRYMIMLPNNIVTGMTEKVPTNMIKNTTLNLKAK